MLVQELCSEQARRNDNIPNVVLTIQRYDIALKRVLVPRLCTHPHGCRLAFGLVFCRAYEDLEHNVDTAAVFDTINS